MKRGMAKFIIAATFILIEGGVFAALYWGGGYTVGQSVLMVLAHFAVGTLLPLAVLLFLEACFALGEADEKKKGGQK